MTYPFPSHSTQTATQPRFPVTEFEPLLDSVEAAALLRIHPKTLQKMARRGVIRGIHIGKCWRFRVSDLNEWLSQESGAQALELRERLRCKLSLLLNLRNCGLTRCEAVTSFTKPAMLANFILRDSDGGFGPEGVSRLYPALHSVTASGQSLRPAASRSSASTVSPVGLRFPLEILFAKCSEKISPEPPQMQSFGLGSRAPRLASPGVTRAGHGKFNKRRRNHVPEQSQPHRIPRR